MRGDEGRRALLIRVRRHLRRQQQGQGRAEGDRQTRVVVGQRHRQHAVAVRGDGREVADRGELGIGRVEHAAAVVEKDPDRREQGRSLRLRQRRAAVVREPQGETRRLERRISRAAVVGHDHRQQVLELPVGDHGLRHVGGGETELSAAVAVPADGAVVERRRQHVRIAVAVDVRRDQIARPRRFRRERALRAEAAPGLSLEPDQGSLLRAGDRGQQIEIAVAVDVRRRHRLDRAAECVGNGLRGAERTAGVLEPRHRVGRARQHVEIAVTVEIRRLHRSRPGQHAEHLLGTEAACTVRVGVPGDFTVDRRRGHHVEIAVVVEITRQRLTGAVRRRADDHLGVEVTLAVGVLVPDDLVVVERGRQHVEVAVTVEIGRTHRLGAVGDRGDHLLGAERAGTVGVLEPAQPIAAGRRAEGGQDVEIAVAVDIRGRHRLRSIGSVGDDLHAAEAAVAVGVLVPGDAPHLLRPCCRQCVQIAVAVEVGGDHRVAAVGQIGDHFACREGGVAMDALIREPGDGVVVERGGEDVDVPVAVHVSGRHRARRIGAGRDHLLGAEATRTVGVLVPGDGVVEERSRDRVEVAVAVDVRGEHRVRVVGRGGDHLLGAEAARAVGVLEPLDGVPIARGRQHVEVAVAVDVRDRHRARCTEAGDHLLRTEGAGTVAVRVPGDLSVACRDGVEVAVAVDVAHRRGARAVGEVRDQLSGGRSCRCRRGSRTRRSRRRTERPRRHPGRRRRRRHRAPPLARRRRAR